MKVLILGVSGFIGSQLRKHLLANGHEVTGFSRSPCTSENGNNTLYKEVLGDFTNVQDLRRVLEDEFDVIYHLVSSTVPQKSVVLPTTDILQDLVPTVQALQLISEQSDALLIFASSGGTVYGPSEPGSISETRPTNPIVPHGIVKLAIEKYLTYFSNQFSLDYCVLRLGNVYGKGQWLRKDGVPFGVVPAFMSRILSNTPIQVYGSTAATRDYVYIDDVCEALELAAKIKPKGQTINIGSGVATPLNDLIRDIEEVTGTQAQLDQQPSRSFDVENSCLEVSKAEQILGWKHSTGLIVGLRSTYHWVRDMDESQPFAEHKV